MTTESSTDATATDESAATAAAHPKLALLRDLLDGHTDRHDERAILDLLAGADAADLDAMLAGVDVDRLIGDVDNRLVVPDHEDEIIELLARTRRAELSHATQAAVIHALQIGRTRTRHEAAIRDMLLAVGGTELTRLKNELNLRTDRHDLEALVFDDIDDDAIRQEILDQIAREAQVVGQLDERKVLCDIDDTVKSAIHDDRWPRGTVYPGILALLEALDVGPADEPFSRGDLTFVTARPTDVFGLMERTSHEALTKAGISARTVLTGSFFALRTHDAMAGKKLANIDDYRLLFPEYDLMFIGDSGQGDVEVGDRMYEAHPDAVRAVFIHDVKGLDAAERARLRGERIYVVDTYAEAARLAHECGLVSAAGLRRVLDESERLAAEVDWDSQEQRAGTTALLERDIAAAREYLARL